MKKRYLTWAGILSAGILVILFIYILATGTFTIFPTATIGTIADLHVGEMLVITGTTNLPAGEDLDLHCYRMPLSSSSDNKYDGFGGRVSIIRGSGLSNTWSFAMDTSAVVPGEYIVKVNRVIAINASDAGYKTGDLLATSRFMLTDTISDLTQPGSVNPNQAVFLTINPPGMRGLGEKFFLNGTTNLPVDTELLLEVIERNDVGTFTIDPKTQEKTEKPGYTVTSLLYVLPGTSGVNRWSTVVDTINFIPGYYLVNISSTKGSVEARNITEGDIFGTSFLVVQESSANSTASNVPGAA
jgi:hypothetical protein